MENLNQAFFFVVDKIIDMMGFFRDRALEIGRVVLLIAILSAALNYALTGTGLKENIIKIMKATVFFIIVIGVYPAIIGFITSWTFTLARDSVGNSVERYYNTNRNEIAQLIDEKKTTSVVQELGSGNHHYFKTIETIVPGDPASYFTSLIREKTHPQMTYSAVPPAAVFRIIMLVAGECFNLGDKAGKTEFNKILKGLICAFFIILTGIFAVLEYLVCFLEFMLVASVGVILFPLSLWEGSKFMSEKFIGAILGFFMKLLFCNIAIFLLLYGYISLAYQFANKPFGGLADEIIAVLFICLLFFYICKSAPGIAQSLLTGVPSLSASGAISAVGGAVAAAGATMSIAKRAGRTAAGGAAKTAFGASGMLSAANAAAGAVAGAGGTGSQQAGAFMRSIGGSAGSAISAGAYGLTRSLLGGSNAGENPHSWQDNFNKFVHKGGEKEGEQITYSDYRAVRRKEGAENALAHYNKKHPSQVDNAGTT